MLTSSEPMPQQPEILLQLRQKAAELRAEHSSLRQENKNYANSLARSSDELDALLREKEIQEQKSRSLMLLVSDLQRQIDDFYSLGPVDEDEEMLVGENKLLRELLVKLAERAKEDQKMLSFLRQAAASGGRAQEFLQRSKYLEGQTELLAKLRSQIASFSNINMECSRKWSELGRETSRVQKEQGFIRIQLERVKTELREYYEEYLECLNRSKATLVNFNETQRERVVTEHLVQEVALLQEKRLGIQQQSKNLKHHQQTLLEENTRIQMENRELKSFFIGNQGEEERLASKMKARIEELRDSLIEVQKARTLPQLPVNNLAEVIRSKLRGLEETIDYVQKKLREQQEGRISLEQKDVVAFFQGVLQGKDQRLRISRQREVASNQRLKELMIRRELLANQISNLEEGMRYHTYESTAYKIPASSLQNPQSKAQAYDNSTNVASLPRNWRERRLNQTNLLTTASKFLP